MLVMLTQHQHGVSLAEWYGNINNVVLHWAWLVFGWVTVCGQIKLASPLCNQPLSFLSSLIW